jgi:polar amino acid transport system substrate-binding protein
MKAGWKSLVIAAGIALSVGLNAGVAQAQTVTDIIKRGKARIGVLIGAPPYGMVDARGNPIGYDADVAAAIGKYMGVPIEMVGLTPPSRIPALDAGKVDFLVSTLAPTAERAKAVMFSIPYSAFQVGIYAKKDDGIKGWPDLKGKKVGVNRGSSLEAELLKHKSEGYEIVYFEDDATVLQSLFSGQVQAVASPDAQANAAIKLRNDTTSELKFFFGKQPNSMAMRKDAFELHQYLNTIIYNMKLSGELDELSRKWVGSPLPELPTF